MGPLVILDVWRARGSGTMPLNSNLSTVWLASLSKESSEAACSFLLEFPEVSDPETAVRQLLWTGSFKRAAKALEGTGPSTMPLGSIGDGAISATAALFPCDLGAEASEVRRRRAIQSETVIEEFEKLLSAGKFKGAKVLARLDASSAKLSRDQAGRLAETLARAEEAAIGAAVSERGGREPSPAKPKAPRL